MQGREIIKQTRTNVFFPPRTTDEKFRGSALLTLMIISETFDVGPYHPPRQGLEPSQASGVSGLVSFRSRSGTHTYCSVASEIYVSNGRRRTVEEYNIPEETDRLLTAKFVPINVKIGNDSRDVFQSSWSALELLVLTHEENGVGMKSQEQRRLTRNIVSLGACGVIPLLMEFKQAPLCWRESSKLSTLVESSWESSCTIVETKQSFRCCGYYRCYRSSSGFLREYESSRLVSRDYQQLLPR